VLILHNVIAISSVTVFFNFYMGIIGKMEGIIGENLGNNSRNIENGGIE